MAADSSLILWRKLLLEANPNCSWASEMVLNPGVVHDEKSGRLHMLFRATGPTAEKGLPETPPPFPIYLGYAWSDDGGETWEADWSRPAYSPKLAWNESEIVTKNVWGETCVDYSNGCVEDPRMFWMEGECYVLVACRVFPPGPYWLHDEPTQCAPAWAKDSATTKLGKAATENVTVNVLLKVDLEKLSAHQYECAFSYVSHLTDPQHGENRDVILFPEKIKNAQGEMVYMMLHRPWKPSLFLSNEEGTPPSILAAEAKDLRELATANATHHMVCEPVFQWESNRIGASGPLVKIGAHEWLLSYHGKRNQEEGYTQSFIILSTASGVPTVTHRCPERVMYPVESWEQPGKFKSPVIFITGMIEVNGNLLVSYGAADERVGVAMLDLEKVLATVRGYDAKGKRF